MNIAENEFSVSGKATVQPKKLPFSLMAAVVGLSLCPIILHSAGFDFSSMNASHIPDTGLVQGAIIHALLEWSSVIISLITAFFAFTHYRVNQNIAVPVIALALFSSGIMDAFHTMAATHLIHNSGDNARFIPFTWALARGFHIAILIIGVFLLLLMPEGLNRLNHLSRNNSGKFYFITLISIVFIGSASLLVTVAANSEYLPQTQFPDAFISRPYDAVPLLLIILATPLFWQLWTRNKSHFSFSLLLSLAPHFMVEAHMAFGSTQLFDAHFNIAHGLKILAYSIPLLGLILDYLGASLRLKAEIEARKRALTALAEAKNRAEEASRLKSDFLANMSHEIRTPMNGIIGTTGLLLNSSLSAQQRHYADTTMKSANALLSLVNDILDLSKIEADKLELEDIPFNLEYLASDIVELSTAKCREKNIELWLHLNPDTPLDVKGDPGRVRQILLNLLSNAIKFTSKGHIIVHIKPGRPHADGRLFLDFEVTDTGTGIPQDKQALIFGKFDQADNSTTRKYGGTGLGLAISKKLCEAMGGNISVTSKEGEGSCFSFSVPFHKIATPKARETQPQLTGQRLLVIDPSKLTQQIVKSQLDHLGMDIDISQTGADALAYVKQKEASEPAYDFVIFDQKIIDIDFQEFSRQYHAINTHSPFFIMLTGTPKKGDTQKAKNLGFHAYLPKPILPNELPQLFDHILKSYRGEKTSAHTDTLITRHSLRENERTHQQTPSFDGKRILLAEDNAINRMVATNMLERHKCLVTPAGNGLEAVALFKERHFDLIFMDCQMPEMDGFDAAEEIRIVEASRGKNRAPIIAFTASAMMGDRERCLKAGMDDFLSKPVHPDTLAKMLSTWLKQPGESNSSQTRSAGSGLVDKNILLDLKQVVGDQYIILLESFIKHAEETRAKIADASERKNAEALHQLSHSLRSSAFQLGATSLGDTCRELEELARDGDLFATQPLVEKLLSLSQDVLKLLKRHVAEEKQLAPQE